MEANGWMLRSKPQVLAETRCKAGLSTEALAKKAGVAGTTVRAVELDAIGVQPHTAKKIADALGMECVTDGFTLGRRKDT